MQYKPLETATAKLDRAQHHLNQLDSDIRRDRNNKVYGISYDRDSKTGEWIIRALLPQAPFIHYSIVGGEIVGHARSALEHAVWDLVPSPAPRKTGFPVFIAQTKADAAALGEKDYYEGKGLKMIDGMNPAAKTIIRGLQPFGPNYKADRLYILNELWNVDKHRLLNSCVHYLNAIQLMYTLSGQSSDRCIAIPNDVEDGAELFRFSGDAVNVQAEVDTSEIQFDGGLLDGQPFFELLSRLFNFSKDTVEKLRATI